MQKKISAKPEQSKTTANGKYWFINDKNDIDFSNPAFRQYYFFESHHEEAFGVRVSKRCFRSTDRRNSFKWLRCDICKALYKSNGLTLYYFHLMYTYLLYIDV